jgi:hypothetical protein
MVKELNENLIDSIHRQTLPLKVIRGFPTYPHFIQTLLALSPGRM